MGCLIKWRDFGGVPINNIIVTSVTCHNVTWLQSVYKGLNILWSKFRSWFLKYYAPPTSDLHIEYVHMRSQVKSNWSEFTLVRGVFSIFFHINFISLWVWVHFGQYFTSVKLTELKFSNQCEISCEHIFTWSEFSTLNEMSLWRNLLGQFKLTSAHAPKMKCSCGQIKIFKTSLQLKNFSNRFEIFIWTNSDSSFTMVTYKLLLF